MNELQIVQSRGEIVAQQTVGAELFTLLSTMAYVAELERKKMLRRQREGIEAAKARGLYNPGRPKVNVDGFDSLYEKTQAGELTVSKAALQLGISRRTWYNLVKEVV